MHTQLAVLGGGPGGYAAAFIAADEGLEVTLIEQDSRLGGTCLLRGCIPSKALLHVARVLSEVDELGNDWGVRFSSPEIDLDRVRARKNEVIEKMSGGLRQLAKRRNVRVIHAQGALLDAHTLALAGEDSSIPEGGRLTFDHLILATGSTPARPGSLAVESPRVIDSTGALELEEIPGTMLVVGGGYIGLEMATVYARLGCKVSIVELTDGLLPGADRDLVRPLQQHMKALTEDRIFLNTKVGSVGERGDKVEVAFEGPAKYGTEHYDRVLVAVGRRPNSRGIGLENTRIQVDRAGFVQCDAQQRTAEPHILAIGDLAGQPMLAHKASHEAKVAVETVLGKPAAFAPAAIPAVVFTDPEVAWAGLTEEDAKRQNRAYEVATYPWAASGRAQALGRSEGLTKWLIDPETNRVLGCGIVGPGAGDLISEAVLAIEMGCEVRDLTESIHPHPTLSETLMNAGEVYYGSAVEIYKPRRK
jgi:dihydrolipoamide dehydrogenase